MPRLTLAVSTLTIFLACGTSRTRATDPEPTFVEVELARKSLLGTPQLDDPLVTTLLADPNVIEVIPRRSLAFAARGSGVLDGSDVTFEVGGFADGVAPDQVTGDPRVTTLFRDHDSRDVGTTCEPARPCGDDLYCDQSDGLCHHRVPAVVSPTLVVLYNDQFARSHGLDRIDSLAAYIDTHPASTRFTIELGATNVEGIRLSPKRRKVEAVIVGTSPMAKPIGLTLPIEYIARWNREFMDDKAPVAYSSLVVKVRDRAMFERAATKLELDVHDWESTGKRGP